jgi:hypothetical protein
MMHVIYYANDLHEGLFMSADADSLDMVLNAACQLPREQL